MLILLWDALHFRQPFLPAGDFQAFQIQPRSACINTPEVNWKQPNRIRRAKKEMELLSVGKRNSPTLIPLESFILASCLLAALIAALIHLIRFQNIVQRISLSMPCLNCASFDSGLRK
jgi:hypothetical protein